MEMEGLPDLPAGLLANCAAAQQQFLAMKVCGMLDTSPACTDSLKGTHNTHICTRRYRCIPYVCMYVYIYIYAYVELLSRTVVGQCADFQPRPEMLVVLPCSHVMSCKWQKCAHAFDIYQNMRACTYALRTCSCSPSMQFFPAATRGVTKTTKRHWANARHPLLLLTFCSSLFFN